MSLDFTFGSVCSGIEAASVAWHPIGGRALWLAEIDPFCCELLHHHYGAGRPKYMPAPELAIDAEDKQAREAAIKAVARIPIHGKITNYGDITQVRDDEMDPVDVLVGGTPCQSFSIAGLRGGMNDARGNLTLRFVEIADAIRPVSILWENVPGVLSDKTNGFGCLLGGLVGADSPLVPGRGQRWTRAGVVDGPERSAAWRILDAQYFRLAQRRERVFVVASPRNGTHPAEILLIEPGVRRNYPPRREERERTAGTLSARTSGGGGLGTDFDIGGGLYQVSPALTSSGRGVERVGESRGQDCVVPVMYPSHDIAPCIQERGGKGPDSDCTMALVTHALRAEGVDASEDGTGRGTPLVPLVPWLPQGYRVQWVDDAGDTVTNNPAGGTRINPVLAPVVAHSDGGGSGVPTVAFNLRGRDGGAMPEVADVASLRSASGGSSRSYIASEWAVRRLTPIETARLQGFPDTYAHIPRRPRKIDAEEAAHYLSHGIDCWQTVEQWWTKAAAEGPIYKAHGNSMAVAVMSWLGVRIKEALEG